MIYRDDDAARGARADALIGEIAALERAKVARVELDQRLAVARQELSMLQLAPASPPIEPRPGLLVHLLVFGAAAGATFVAYSLLC